MNILFTYFVFMCFSNLAPLTRIPSWKPPVQREVFGENFGLVLLGHSEQKKTSAKTSAQSSHDSAQQDWQKFREKLQDGT